MEEREAGNLQELFLIPLHSLALHSGKMEKAYRGRRVTQVIVKYGASERREAISKTLLLVLVSLPQWTGAYQ